MPSPETIQKLIEARGAGLKKASEKRDIDELMSWHSHEATFVNRNQNVHLQGIEAVRNFYTQAYAAFPIFRILEAKATGTAEFVASELRCEGEAAMDLPHMNMEAGGTLELTGVSLFWYRWEGPGEAWDGSLSDEAVRGWKIVEEHAYYSTQVRKAAVS